MGPPPSTGTCSRSPSDTAPTSSPSRGPRGGDRPSRVPARIDPCHSCRERGGLASGPPGALERGSAAGGPRHARDPGTAGIGPPVTHDEALSRALLAVTRAGGRAWRAEVGLFRDMRGEKHNIGTKGMSDLIGLCPGGRALSVEVKTGNARRTIEQRAWADMWAR